MPGVGATARRPQAGEPQLSAKSLCQGLELIELADVVAGHHHTDLELAEPSLVEVGHGGNSGVERTFSAHGVVGGGVGSVDRNLDVDIVGRGEPAGHISIDARSVG